MNDKIKSFAVCGIAGGFINGVFWFAYTHTDNLVGSIGITGAVSIGVFGFLYKLGEMAKREKS
jgi:hypothetical protein